ncbi:hypothetical protein ACFT4A_27400 [Streptomyces sp. NPDC057099]|uniref:hypothetical protein n=1 Tax=Streptomyces sp. NPDC057099 TaxID=3346019 RepID=UPI00362BE6FF
MTRIPGLRALLILFVFVVATSAVAGCADRGPDTAPDRGHSPAAPAPRPAIHLGTDGDRALVPGGPPLPFRVTVAGLTETQAARRVLALYIGTVPDRLQIREDEAWRDVRLQWTNEQDDDGEFAAVLPLLHRGKARNKIEFRIFTADQRRSYVDGQVPAVADTIAAQLAPARKGWAPDTHPAASASRVRLPVDPTHLAIEVPQLLRATEGGPSVEWEVRVRNVAGKLTRSGLRIAITLSPGAAGQSVSRLHWSIDQEDRWTDLTGRAHVETDEFALAPGESRTVRIRIALPTGATSKNTGDLAAALSAAVSAPWWPSDPDEPSGVSLDAESTNVLAQG